MALRWKIAVIEDDQRLARAVVAGLRRDGYRVQSAETAAEGLSMVREWNPDVVLLDLMLPDNQGPELFARFRGETNAALIGMTARSLLSDVVTGLRNGADDYVVKPFAIEELSARIAALVRRLRSTGGETMRLGDLVVDIGAGTAYRGNRDLQLTATEFRLLSQLIRNSGRVLNQAQLTDSIWSVEGAPESNSIEVHIGRLRRKLEGRNEERILHTVRGMGYVLKTGTPV
jgi:two-component system, OmpR family, response regulator MprA